MRLSFFRRAYRGPATLFRPVAHLRFEIKARAIFEKVQKTSKTAKAIDLASKHMNSPALTQLVALRKIKRALPKGQKVLLGQINSQIKYGETYL